MSYLVETSKVDLIIINLQNMTTNNLQCRYLTYESQESLKDYLHLDNDSYDKFLSNFDLNKNQENNVSIFQGSQNFAFVPLNGIITYKTESDKNHFETINFVSLGMVITNEDKSITKVSLIVKQ